jgi:hypothetical protein
MYACYVVYNDALLFELSLRSIIDYVEKVIVVDGAWKSFPYGEYPESTDGTKEIAEKICGDKLIWVDCKEENGKCVPWETEIEKRSEYLKYVPTGKWFLVIDSDEVILGEIQREFEIIEKQHCKICMVPLITRSIHPEEGILWVTWLGHGNRIYKKEEGMVYKGHHSLIWIGEEEAINRGKIHITRQKVRVNFLPALSITSSTLSYDAKYDYILNEVIIQHLRHLRQFDRLNQAEADKTSPIRETGRTIEERILETKIKPLFIIFNPRNIEWILTTLKRVDYVDKLWIKYYDIDDANRIATEFFASHKEYTHAILLCDDAPIKYNDIAMLVADDEKYDLPVISGCCPINKNAGKDLRLNLSFNRVMKRVPVLGKDFITEKLYYFLPNEFRELNGIIRVWFQGNACGMLRRDAFEAIGGMIPIPQHHFGVDLSQACRLHENKIPQYTDLRVYLNHYRYGFNSGIGQILVGKREPYIKFEKATKQIPKLSPAKIIRTFPEKYVRMLDRYCSTKPEPKTPQPTTHPPLEKKVEQVKVKPSQKVEPKSIEKKPLPEIESPKKEPQQIPRPH